MSSSNWPRTDNFFKTAANKSYIGAKGIFNALDTKLHGGIADPDILVFYNTFHPLNVTYNTDYAVWDGLRSTNMGKTLGVVQLMDQLQSTKAKAWDIATQAIYPDNTTQYKHVFPHRRIHFQSGSVENRVAAVTNLISAIGADASLATVKASAVAFLALIEAAILAQTDQITGIDTAITNLETSSNNASDEALGIFGSLIAKFKVTPKSIDIYMPVSLLQNIVQLSFKITLKNMLAKPLFTRKLNTAKNMIRGTNVGTFAIKGFFNNGLSDRPEVGAPIITIEGDSTIDFNPIDAGYTDLKRHFHVINMGILDAVVTISIMVVN